MPRYIEAAVSADQSILEPPFETNVATLTTEGGLNFRVASAGDEYFGDTLLFEQPWSGYVDRADVKDQLRMTAASFECHVIAIDNLGVGDGTSKIPRGWHRDFRDGDFTRLSDAHLEILHRKRENDLGKLSIAAYSMGGALAASLLMRADNLRFDEVIFMETVGASRQNPLTLARQFGIESAVWMKNYTKNASLQLDWMNKPGQDKTMVRRMLKSPSGYTDYPQGLTKGRMLADLRSAYDEGVIDKDTRVLVMSGENSRVSSLADNTKLARSVEAMGVERVTQLLLRGESHGILDGMAKFAPAMVLARYCIASE